MDIKEVTKHREWLHRNAELSFEEYRTQDYICGVLDSFGIEYRRIVGTGVLAIIGSPEDECVVLRCDIDALPIEETSGVEYCSENKGVMHACGHDMHTAALLGALARLKAQKPEGRTILGLFQPGEELAPGGAIKVLNEGVFSGYDVRAVIGIHTSPELETGVIGIREGAFMASTDEVHITVEGKGGHAARPESLRNPVWAAVELLSKLHRLSPTDASIPHILAFGRVEALGATNVIPDRVKIEGTFRTFSEEWREGCKAMMREIAGEVAASHGVEIAVETAGGYPSVVNNPALYSSAKEILGGVFPQDKIVRIPKRMTAEDFGWYSLYFPSLFVRFGVTPEGVQPTELHRSNFVADSSALACGVSIYELLARGVK